MVELVLDDQLTLKHLNLFRISAAGLLGILTLAPVRASYAEASSTPETRNIAQATNALPGDQEFAKQFQKNVYQGCANKPNKNIKDHKRYCSCYAGSYLARYTPTELKAISLAGERGSQIVNTIVLMMSPEIKACIKSAQ